MGDRRRVAGALSHSALLAWVAALLLIALPARADTLRGEGFVVEFPSHARDQAERIVDEFSRRQRVAAEWLGRKPAGRVRVHLVDDLDGMRAVAGPGVPEWAVAVTRRDDLLVFRLDKVDKSPTESLPLVLKHELIHQALNHLARRRPLPRWFEEGLCVHHAGVAYLQPATSLERTAAAGNLPTFADADELFAGNARGAALAYEFGERAVREFLGRFGDDVLRRLLALFDGGRTFAAAFQEATGEPLGLFEKEWRASVTPKIPFWLFVILENIEMALLCFGALIVAGGYVAWRLRRERAMQRLDATSP